MSPFYKGDLLNAQILILEKKIRECNDDVYTSYREAKLCSWKCDFVILEELELNFNISNDDRLLRIILRWVRAKLTFHGKNKHI